MKKMKTWFRGLRGRFLFLAAFPVAVLGANIFISLQSQNQIIQQMDEGFEKILPAVLHSGNMDSAKNAMVSWAFLACDEKSGAELKKKALESAKMELDRFQSAQSAFNQTDLPKEITELYQPIKENWPNAEAEFGQVIAKLEAENSAEAKQILTLKMIPKMEPISAAFELLGNKFLKERDRLSLTSEKTVKQSRQTMWLTGLTAAFLNFLITFWMARQIANSLTKISSQLSIVSTSVDDASHELTQSSELVSSSATESAAAIEETVASYEELSSMVKANTENSNQAAMLSKSSTLAVETGEKEISDLIGSMSEVAQSSKKIEEITSVIDDIAFQTNLLALNAAVEAARAGEQGKGFAVVADAVRALALRSAVAAKDISFLIRQSVGTIEKGSASASKSGTALGDIMISIEKVSGINTEIAEASKEQSQGITQIGQAMNDLDKTSQENALSAEKMAATSRELQDQAQSLKEMISQLVEIIEGPTSRNL